MWALTSTEILDIIGKVSFKGQGTNMHYQTYALVQKQHVS